jgi:sirohydrochlorin cobaltochelatase
MKPDLHEAARTLAAEGVKAVTVVPLFLAQGKHLKRELPEMVEALKRKHRGMEFRVTPALGEEPEILAAITAWVERAVR